MSSEDDLPGEPVCLADRLVDGHIVDPQTWLDVSRYRKAQRIRLYAARRTMSSRERAERTTALIGHLKSALSGRNAQKIAAYWPIRGEPDLRPLLAELVADGRTVLLPVVAGKQEPLVFRSWSPGCDMVRGTWNIPVPAAGEPQEPGLVISPLLGFDPALYRLGNGGGFYDRTLAAFRDKPLTIGVGYAHGRLPSIFPMTWDIPMDLLVTEEGWLRSGSGENGHDLPAPHS